MFRLWFRRPDPTLDVSEAARTLGFAHRTSERNRIIDTANEMRARMGKPGLIPRRPR